MAGRPLCFASVSCTELQPPNSSRCPAAAAPPWRDGRPSLLPTRRRALSSPLLSRCSCCAPSGHLHCGWRAAGLCRTHGGLLPSSRRATDQLPRGRSAARPHRPSGARLRCGRHAAGTRHPSGTPPLCGRHLATAPTPSSPRQPRPQPFALLFMLRSRPSPASGRPSPTFRRRTPLSTPGGTTKYCKPSAATPSPTTSSPWSLTR
jgi:hypothetical protein